MVKKEMELEVQIAEVPVMIGSKLCYLEGLSKTRVN